MNNLEHRIFEDLTLNEHISTTDQISDYVTSQFLPNGGGTIDGSLHVNDRLTVGENVSALTNNSMAIGKGCVAGSKYFKITAADKVQKTFTLAETSEQELEKLAANDQYSCQIGSNWDYFSKITSVNVEEKTITVAEIVPFESSGLPGKLWIPKKPTAGDVIFEKGWQFAQGENCIACNESAHAEGQDCIASGKRSHAEGMGTIAGYASHAEGSKTQALGLDSHAEGSNTKAIGQISHAEGSSGIAYGTASHVEGTSNKTYGSWSHAEGENNVITENGRSGHVEGRMTSCDCPFGHAEGLSTMVSASYYGEGQVDWTGSHAEGAHTLACKSGAHAEGSHSKAIGLAAHAEGVSCIAMTNASMGSVHAEGYSTSAIAYATHAEGISCFAGSPGSHVEGVQCKTLSSSDYSHVEGYKCQAISSQYAYVAGHSTVLSSSDYAFAYNPDKSKSYVVANRPFTFNINPKDGI